MEGVGGSGKVLDLAEVDAKPSLASPLVSYQLDMRASTRTLTIPWPRSLIETITRPACWIGPNSHLLVLPVFVYLLHHFAPRISLPLAMLFNQFGQIRRFASVLEEFMLQQILRSSALSSAPNLTHPPSADLAAGKD